MKSVEVSGIEPKSEGMYPLCATFTKLGRDQLDHAQNIGIPNQVIDNGIYRTVWRLRCRKS